MAFEHNQNVGCLPMHFTVQDYAQKNCTACTSYLCSSSSAYYWVATVGKAMAWIVFTAVCKNLWLFVDISLIWEIFSPNFDKSTHFWVKFSQGYRNLFAP